MSDAPRIHPTAEVDPLAHIGAGTAVWNWSKLREGVSVGRDCSIGQAVYVDHGVRIGDGCKIQNGVSIYHGVSLGDHVFIGPNATFTNDRVPRADSGDDWTVSSTIVEDHASVGANATIVCGVRLGRGCMVGAGAVVVHDVPPQALVVGNPARILDFVALDGTRLGVGARGSAADVTGLGPDAPPEDQATTGARPARRRRRDEPVRVAVVGVGEMGANHARVYAGLKGADLVAVIDPEQERAAQVAALHGCQVWHDVAELAGRVDAVSIATPPATHADIGRRLLDQHIACLVEKPVATTEEDALALIAAAEEAGVPLLVGHIERFNPAVAQLDEIVGDDRQILAVEARRMSAVSARIKDVDVVADLMVHDLDIVCDLVRAEVVDVAARAVHRGDGAGGDFVTALLSFADGALASVTASRVTQSQIRQLQVTTDHRLFTVDYSNQELLIFRQGRLGGVGGGQPEGSRYVLDVGTERVFVRRVEPLVAELTHFLSVVRGDSPPRVDGRQALTSLRLVLEISRQIRAQAQGTRDGAPIAAGLTAPIGGRTA